jgi:hypothetical protein
MPGAQQAGNPMIHSTRLRNAGFGLLLLLIVAGIVLLGVLPNPSATQLPDVRTWSWIGIMILMVSFIVLAGKAITGFWRGALIDERNQISLSRFQLTLWTSLILSAFLEAALSNIRAHAPSPITIAMPAEIWAVLGIATTSLVGSPLILRTKQDRLPGSAQEAKTLQALADAGTNATAQGQVVYYQSPADASWSDMFTGDEISNATHLDLGKVQMFFFTVILVLAYGVALGSLFLHTHGKIASFPRVDPGMIALLGISHAGYLSYKAVPRSDSPAGGQDAPAPIPPS